VVTQAENELLTRVEGDAPMARLMREHYWIPFALSSNLVVGDGPTPVRLFGENYVAFRDMDGKIGFLDELCPHRRASLVLARHEGDGIRCIYHGWKMSAEGKVLECPTQTIRAEQFAARVPVVHFPVHEAGGVAWVWLGDGDAPPFPDLPFAEEGVNNAFTFSVIPCNWLQGFEGGLDSVHGTILHKSWIGEILEDKNRSPEDLKGLALAQSAVPRYETEPAPYGMRTCSLRPAEDDRTHARTAHYFFPLVIVVPTGHRGLIHFFAFAPVDDTHHLLFFGNYGEAPLYPHEIGGVRPGFQPDVRNYTGFGDEFRKDNRWGQDRDLMGHGHYTGFGRSALDEDAAVQVSMGPRVDHSKENLSSSDVAIANARRLLLDALEAVASGQLPPGSVRSPEPVRVPNPVDALLSEGESWRESAASVL
jgi:phthalate 4,5-dioxygenase oxygenase subunit